MSLTEGEYIMSTLGVFCFMIVGLVILAWMYDWL
jgi:hypothetical protein